MELLNKPQFRLFRLKYQKSKFKVKDWEQKFKSEHGCNPSKKDIKNASFSVREAYKNYYELKTLLLHYSLSDESFGSDDKNIPIEDSKEVTSNGTENNTAIVSDASNSNLHAEQVSDSQGTRLPATSDTVLDNDAKDSPPGNLTATSNGLVAHSGGKVSSVDSVTFSSDCSTVENITYDYNALNYKDLRNEKDNTQTFLNGDSFSSNLGPTKGSNMSNGNVADHDESITQNRCNGDFSNHSYQAVPDDSVFAEKKCRTNNNSFSAEVEQDISTKSMSFDGSDNGFVTDKCDFLVDNSDAAVDYVEKQTLLSAVNQSEKCAENAENKSGSTNVSTDCDSILQNVDGVWGEQLNKVNKKELSQKNKGSFSSHVAQRLLQSANFKIRNPRKPLSQKRSKMRYSSFGELSSNSESDCSQTLNQDSLSESVSLSSPQDVSSPCDIFQIPVKYKTASLSTQPVKSLSLADTETSAHIKQLDQGWLERCSTSFVNEEISNNSDPANLECRNSVEHDSIVSNDFISQKENVSNDFISQKENVSNDFISQKENVSNDFISQKENVSNDFISQKENVKQLQAASSNGDHSKDAFKNDCDEDDDDIIDDSDEEFVYDSEVESLPPSRLAMAFALQRKRKSYEDSSECQSSRESISKKTRISSKEDEDEDMLSCSSKPTHVTMPKKITYNHTTKKKAPLSKEERLREKMTTGKGNENYVKVNLKKKIYVRGKRSMTYTKYKKQEWKKKKKLAASADIQKIQTCFKCGDVGHFARHCNNAGDKLLPCEEEEYEESPFPTLEEAKAMTTEVSHYGRRKPLISLQESDKILETTGLPESFSESLGVESFKLQSVEPVYKLNDDNSLIDTPLEVLEVLAKFGHNGFRPGQEEAVMRILSGLSTLVTLATGAGKSLCYQVPAYLYSRKRKAVTLVVSPLVSLMEDQVVGIPKCLRAACLHTSQTANQREKVIELAKSGSLDILLVSPEAVVSGERATGFGSILRQLPLIAFACVDEVHCVSQWSHNFRPSYLLLCQVLRDKLGVKTILGLTATATETTCQSIAKHLNIPDGEDGIVKGTVLPDNLTLCVSRDRDRNEALVSLLKSPRLASCNSIIVYCTRREDCERLAVLLRTCLQTVSSENKKRISNVAEAYHAGLSATRRKQVQNAFMSEQLRIVIATVAFGMGINKNNIRAVIHYNMPSSFERYVQEIGRAGRDGEPAYCHLFLNSEGGDLCELKRHIHADSTDRHVIRKLLKRVFPTCQCKPSCEKHEVAFEVGDTVQALDLPQENILTMLCYLHLHPKQWIKVLPCAYTHCKVLSYKGSRPLRTAARECPPLAMAIALNKDHDENSNRIEFPVVQVAASMGWDSGLVKNHLKKLEWQKVDDKWRRTSLTVEFSTLGFRVLAPGNLSPSELDEALDEIHQQVESRERISLQQLHMVSDCLVSVSYKDYSCLESDEEDFVRRSDKLKREIRKYFQKHKPDENVELPETKLQNPEQVQADIRALICMYRDTSFTGRSIARIFHGIASPNYPAQIWGKCKLWRSHMEEDFKLLCKTATAEILALK